MLKNTLTECMHSFNWCGTKNSTHWVCKHNTVESIVDLMLGPLGSSCLITLGNLVHIRCKKIGALCLPVPKVLETDITRSRMTLN